MLVTELSFSCLLLIVVKTSSDVLVALIVSTPATFMETERPVPLKRFTFYQTMWHHISEFEFSKNLLNKIEKLVMTGNVFRSFFWGGGGVGV